MDTSVTPPAPTGLNMFSANVQPRTAIWRPQDFDLIPADELDVRGKFVAHRVTRDGAGASLVAIRNEQAQKFGSDLFRRAFISL